MNASIKVEINRHKLENLTTSIAVTLLGLMVIVLTLVASNYIFSWDLFPPAVEKAGLVTIFASFLTIFASVIINIMINIGRIADKFDNKEKGETVYKNEK